MRRDRLIAVSTSPGHTADTLIGAPTVARSWARHSVAAIAANFDTLYGPLNGVVASPAIEIVFTTCPSVPAATMRGTNARMPCRIPHRLTPRVHSKSASVHSQSSPPWKTPALLHSTSTEPNVS